MQGVETEIAVETGRMVFDARFEQKVADSVQLRNLIENQIGEKFSQVKSTLETWFVSEISSRLANLDLDGTKSTLQEWFVGEITSRLNGWERIWQDKIAAETQILSKKIFDQVVQQKTVDPLDQKFREEVLQRLAKKDVETKFLDAEIAKLRAEMHQNLANPRVPPEIVPLNAGLQRVQKDKHKIPC